MPSADFSHAVRIDPSTLSQFQSHATSQGTWEISRGKTQNLPCVDAGFIKHTHMRMEDFVVTCQLVPSVPHLISGSCSSPRMFRLDFLQTPPRGDALVLLLTFGSAYTWYRDLTSAELSRSLTLLALCHARHTRPSSAVAVKRSVEADR